jgi:histidinol-phosphate aminotransferase
MFLNKASASPAIQKAVTKVPFYGSDRAAFETTPPQLKARLLANENPFGPSPKAKKAIQDAISLSYQYPIESIDLLEEKIAAYEGLQKGQILLGAGSSPLLLAAALYFGKGTIVSATPTYEDLLSHAEQFGTKVIRVPLTAEHHFDLDAMEKVIDKSTSLVYICNPNNPTATVTDPAKLKAFCERVSKITTVFVDEAYIDYMEDPKAVSLIENIKKGQNIIVARTFSKLYGFAGLRVGYMVAQPELIKKFSPYASGPMCLSATSLQAAIAAYEDKEFLQGAFDNTMLSKKFLYETLKSEGYEYIPSSANFVMFPVKMESRRFAEEMMKRGVGVRSWKFGGKEWCRVSIGLMEEMKAFATAFKELS